MTSGKIAGGAVKAGKLGAITVRSDTVQIANNSGDGLTVDCNPGEVLIGGGVAGTNPGTAGWSTYASEPDSDGIGWFGAARNETGGSDGLDVKALCLEAG